MIRVPFQAARGGDDLYCRIRVYFVLFTTLPRALSRERMRNFAQIENDTTLCSAKSKYREI